MRSIINYIDEALFSSASEFSKADNIDELDFVDLGLSVNWANCNLGADKETDFGHYYMWGSTEPNENDKCCWENTPFNNGKSYFAEEYFDSVKNKVCPNNKLINKYDAAYQESNGDYRMPTDEECDELICKSKQKWIENYNNTGINGYKIINKNDESKYIFIPACGVCSQYIRNKNDETEIWSSSLSHPGLAKCISLTSKAIDFDLELTRIGCSIRPVQDK